jgi:hypothetical protein
MCLNETYRKARIHKHLSDTFPFQHGLKQGDASTPLPFNVDFRIRHLEGSRKPGGTKIKWGTSPSGPW